MSAKPKLMKRRSIRKDELLAICKRNGIIPSNGAKYAVPVEKWTVAELKSWLVNHGVCDYSGEAINGQEIDFDHKIPNALLYDGDDIVWEVLLRKWHKIKTKKDVKDIARAKRLAGETGQYARRKRREKPLINGRGFDKTKTKGFDGKVRDRS